MSLFQYVRTAPLKNIDPSGQDTRVATAVWMTKKLAKYQWSCIEEATFLQQLMYMLLKTDPLPLTDDDCCLIGKALYDDFAWGTWVCCGGRKVPCNLRVGVAVGSGSYPERTPGYKKIDEAIESHELAHEHDLGSCDGVADGFACPWDPFLTLGDRERREYHLEQQEQLEIDSFLNEDGVRPPEIVGRSRALANRQWEHKNHPEFDRP